MLLCGTFSAEKCPHNITSQRDDLWRFDEQLRRWSSEDLTSTQRAVVAHLQSQMLRLYDVIDALLRLADFLQRNAPEK